MPKKEVIIFTYTVHLGIIIDKYHKELEEKIYNACKEVLLAEGIPEEKIEIHTPKFTHNDSIYITNEINSYNGFNAILIDTVIMEAGDDYINIKYTPLFSHKDIELSEDEICDEETAKQIYEEYHKRFKEKRKQYPK